MIDADTLTLDARKRELHSRDPFDNTDPVVVLIPKRHVETWICSALGHPVGEEEDCKRILELSREVYRSAADQIYEWARNEPALDSACVPSLRTALPAWRRIG